VKKNLFVTAAVVFAFMAMANMVSAGPECTGSKGSASADCAKTCGIKVIDKADKTSAKADGQSADGQMVSAKVNCDYTGKCETIYMNISGMTCTGCETSITEALLKQEGVIKVVSIDHQSGKATVCFDPTKVESTNLTKLVSNKGYKAEIIPAVATSGTDATNVKACAASTKAEDTKKTDY